MEAFRGALGASWGVLRASWSVLEASWGVLGASWSVLEASWSVLGASWGVLGRKTASSGILEAKRDWARSRFAAPLGRWEPTIIKTKKDLL